MIFQIVRMVAVVALLGVAAAIATPRGRLPLALRGVNKLLGRPVGNPSGEKAPLWKRLVALALVLVALVLIVLPPPAS